MNQVNYCTAERPQVKPPLNARRWADRIKKVGGTKNPPDFDLVESIDICEVVRSNGSVQNYPAYVGRLQPARMEQIPMSALQVAS